MENQKPDTSEGSRKRFFGTRLLNREELRELLELTRARKIPTTALYEIPFGGGVFVQPTLEQMFALAQATTNFNARYQARLQQMLDELFAAKIEKIAQMPLAQYWGVCGFFGGRAHAPDAPPKTR